MKHPNRKVYDIVITVARDTGDEGWTATAETPGTDLRTSMWSRYRGRAIGWAAERQAQKLDRRPDVAVKKGTHA